MEAWTVANMFSDNKENQENPPPTEEPPKEEAPQEASPQEGEANQDGKSS